MNHIKTTMEIIKSNGFLNYIYCTFLMLYTITCGGFAARIFSFATQYDRSRYILYFLGLLLSCIISIIILIDIVITNKNIKAFIFASIVCGIVLRYFYTSITFYDERTHDVVFSDFGHLKYIEHIAKTFTLPSTNAGQGYHPPLHHVLGAVFLRLGQAAKLDDSIAIKIFQFFMATLSCLTIYIYYKILKLLKASPVILAVALSLFCFHPSLIFLSAKINNDNTCFFFMSLTIYFTLRWATDHTLVNIIFAAASFSLALLTKMTAISLLPVIGVVFAVSFFNSFKNERTGFKNFIHYLNQFAIYFIILIPLPLAYYLRNYMMFDQPLNYILDIGRHINTTLSNLFFTPPGVYFAKPFNYSGLGGSPYFWDFLLKSANAGEWTFNGLETVMLGMNILNLLMFAICIIYILIIILKFKFFKNYHYLIILNLIVPVILLMSVRFSHPVSCSQDFRYVVQILIPAGYILGFCADHLMRLAPSLAGMQKTSRFLTGGIIFIVMAYCFLASVFIFNMRFY